MSLRYLWNKLDKMNSLEQQAYITNIFKQFNITPLYPIEENFKDIKGKQSSGKNPLGYIVMHLTDEQLNQLIPEYLRELVQDKSFYTIEQEDIINTIRKLVEKIKQNKTDVYTSPYYRPDVMLEVFQFGVGKYSPWSFLKLNPYTLLPAAFRHLYKYYFISKVDEETGLPHLAHFYCNGRMIDLIIERGNKNA